MKRILLYIACFCLLVAGGVWSATYNEYNGGMYTDNVVTNVTGTNATASTAVVTPLYGPYATHTCVAVWTAGTPTSSDIAISYGIDGTNTASVGTLTITSSGTYTNFTTPPAYYLYTTVTNSNGSATTNVQMRCLSMQ